jgi:hypothetical protein
VFCLREARALTHPHVLQILFFHQPSHIFFLYLDNYHKLTLFSQQTPTSSTPIFIIALRNSCKPMDINHSNTKGNVYNTQQRFQNLACRVDKCINTYRHLSGCCSSHLCCCHAIEWGTLRRLWCHPSPRRRQRATSLLEGGGRGE